MPAPDLPPQLHATVSCSIAAAARYGIPASLMLAVADKEAGQPALWSKNTNGTSDVGPMQFNTVYLATLSRYGVTPQAVAAPGCYAYELAAWRLRRHLQSDLGDLWTRAANYHSRTPYYNARYRADLTVRAARWADWLRRCSAGPCSTILSTQAPALTSASSSALQRRRESPRPAYIPRTITPAAKP